MAHQVFLSHATEDRDAALRVCGLLEAEGIGCWMAPRDVKAGTDYAAAILEGIRTSDLVLLIFSGYANASPYVLREIDRAVAYGRPVLSLRVDDALPNSSIEYYVNLWQKVDAAVGIDTRQDEIITAVRQQLAQAPDASTSRGRGSIPTMRPVVQPHLGGRKGVPRPRRPSRRTVWIALAAVLLVAAVGLGLGLVLTRDAPSSAGLAPGHAAWAELSPPGPRPEARVGHAMVYDPSSGRLIMFGGMTFGANGQGRFFNDTWAYNPIANTWTDLRPSGTLPSGRASFAMVYDPATHRLIMFGGYEGTADSNETWAYDPAANTWTKLTPKGTVPVGLSGQSMVYDPPSGRLIMFGGWGDERHHNETWAYDPAANTWTDLRPSGSLPSARGLPAMAYDPVGRRLIMFGGSDEDAAFNDTWAYDPAANTWTELRPEEALPAGRFGHSMVFDPASGLMIMFGGGPEYTTVFNDTWAYDPAANTWTELSPSGTLPSRRLQPATVYDPSSEQLIMFGGWGQVLLFDDTWAFTP